MLGRLAFFLLLGTLALAVLALSSNWKMELDPGLAEFIGWQQGLSDEEVIRAEMKVKATPAVLEEKIADAVKREDAADAELYIGLADEFGVPLAGRVRQAGEALIAEQSSAMATAAAFAEGFISGTGDGVAGLAGAITSDLTVIGDVRDIIGEGGRMAAGEEYSEFILGLSVIGLAATTATVATGGGGIAVKAAVSTLKFAKRAGHLSVAFIARLTRMLNEAIDMPGFKAMLRQVDLLSPSATARAVGDYAKSVRGAKVFATLGKLEEVRGVVGTTETMRLLKRVDKVEDIDDLRDVTKAAGKRTRGVMEVSGKTSMRAFKYAVNTLQMVLHYIWAVLAWIGSLLLAITWQVSKAAGRVLVRSVKFAQSRARSPRRLMTR